MKINTKKVPARRKLRFQTLTEILQEAELLAAAQTVELGNWSAGQIFLHLARSIDMSIDGRPPAAWYFRFVARVVIGKQRFIRRPMPAGFQLPRSSRDLVPGRTATGAGLLALRSAIERLGKSQHRAPHPAFGPMSREEWEQLHLRHAELHLSFLLPATQRGDDTASNRKQSPSLG